MIVVPGPREMLLDLAVGRIPPDRVGMTMESFPVVLPFAPVVAVYFGSSDRGEPPQLIIHDPAKHSTRDLFAWTSTYLPQWFPLTATTRVVSRDDRKLIQLLTRATSITDVSSFAVRRLMAACIAAEALIEMHGVDRQGPPTLLAVRSTFSYAAARALSLAANPDLRDLFIQLEQLDRLVGSPSRIARRQTLEYLWIPLVDPLTSSRPFGQDSLRQEVSILADRLIRSDQVAAPDAGRRARTLGLRSLSDSQARREDRLDSVYSRVRELLLTQERLSLADSIAVAQAVAEFSDGPLSHWDVVAQMTNWQPEPLLWYALLSSSMSERSADARTESLLTRLACELGTLWSLQPDISWDELRVAATERDGLQSLRTGYALLNVEICPFVTVPVRLGQVRSEAPQPTAGQSDDRTARFEAAINELRRISGINENKADLFSSSGPSSRRTPRKKRSK